MKKLLFLSLIFTLTTPTYARDYSKTNFSYSSIGLQGGSVILDEKINLGEDTYTELMVWGFALSYQLPNNVILGFNRTYGDATGLVSSVKTKNTGYLLGYAFSMNQYDLYAHIGQYRQSSEACYLTTCRTTDKIVYGADLGTRIAVYKDFELGINLKGMDVFGTEVYGVLGVHQAINMTPNSNLVITQQYNSNGNLTFAVGSKINF